MGPVIVRLSLIIICFMLTYNIVFARQLDFDTYRKLSEGMSEAEVLTIAGYPDKEIYFDSEFFRTQKSMKQYVYIPSSEESDPTVTTITIQNGKVIDLEREKILSPLHKGSGGYIDLELFSKLGVGMTEGKLVAIIGDPNKVDEYIDKDGKTLVKRYYYLPAPDSKDPHTTEITLKKGIVIDIERSKVFN